MVVNYELVSMAIVLSPAYFASIMGSLVAIGNITCDFTKVGYALL